MEELEVEEWVSLLLAAFDPTVLILLCTASHIFSTSLMEIGCAIFGCTYMRKHIAFVFMSSESILLFFSLSISLNPSVLQPGQSSSEFIVLIGEFTVLYSEHCFVFLNEFTRALLWLYASWNLLAISCLVNVGNEAAGQNCLLSMAAAFYDIVICLSELVDRVSEMKLGVKIAYCPWLLLFYDVYCVIILMRMQFAFLCMLLCVWLDACNSACGALCMAHSRSQAREFYVVLCSHRIVFWFLAKCTFQALSVNQCQVEILCLLGYFPSQTLCYKECSMILRIGARLSWNSLLTAFSLALLTVILLAFFSPVPRDKNQSNKSTTRPRLALSLYIQQPQVSSSEVQPAVRSEAGAFIFHRKLTEGLENTSRVIGKAQGFIIPVENFAYSGFNIIHLTFDAPDYSGSLSVQAKHLEHKDREELTVVGGTGSFAFARGLAVFSQTGPRATDVDGTFHVKLQLQLRFPDRSHTHIPG
ncbi:hypothetical protein DKX38_002759 [Salix brachista]|uniref:Dirigent protein n=1 Tax=Salix brachista TaxID=2182728 RepID=A0A5N5NRP7_9ROSI|nr:hypothetical protein DKX38_002759 [Salix brachista]